MTPPRTQTQGKPVSARLARVMLIVFGIRHVLGIGVFIALTVMFYNVGGLGWLGVLAGTLVYTVVAALNFRKLFRQYRRRRAAEAQVGS